PVRREVDLLHLHLGLCQLLLAVPLQQRTALIGGDRFVEFYFALLELRDDALELLQRVLEGQAGHFLRQCGFFRQYSPLKGVRADGSRAGPGGPAEGPQGTCKFVRFREGFPVFSTLAKETRIWVMAALHVRRPKPIIAHCGTYGAVAASV